MSMQTTCVSRSDQAAAAGTSHSRFQAGHYPTDLIDIWHLRCGTRVTLRPVLPQDAPLLADLVTRLSSKSRRNRFHCATNSLSTHQLLHMSCVDYLQHMALVITTGQRGQEQVIAEARYFVRDPRISDVAEFAVTVDDRWLRHGLGVRIMQALTTAAQVAGLYSLRGEVLAHNQPMLALMQHCQFDLMPDEQDNGIIHSQLDLHRPPLRTASMRRTSWRRWLGWLRRTPSTGLGAIGGAGVK